MSDEKNNNNIKLEMTMYPWNNQGNDIFYQRVKVEGLKKLAKRSGLLSGCDIKILRPYWHDATTILDVGSGFGRVVDALIRFGYEGKMTAIERNDEQYAYLKQKYQAHATILQKDIYNLTEMGEKFDVIFFLWSGLADFSPNEQPILIKHLSKLLNKNGAFIIDTMPTGIQPLNTEQFDKQSFLTRYGDSIVHTYEANRYEIENYAKISHLNISEVIHCKTETNRLRWLYILQ